MIKEVRIDSWSEFEEAIAEYIAAPSWSGQFAFRGQADAEWSLRSSLLRSITNDFPKLGLVGVERQAIQYFAARAANYLPLVPGRAPTDWLAWWPLMQHYGVPTRLLDWTRSAYVAAYFAVEDLGKEENGAVYFAPFVEVNEATRKANGEKLRDGQFVHKTWDDILKNPNLIEFMSPQHMTDRMTAQQGMYSICTSPLIDHGDTILKVLPEKRHRYFGRIIIPHAHKREFAQRLHYMNITASALFPGMDGLGREIKEFITHQIVTESSPAGVLRANLVLRDDVSDTMSNILDKFREQSVFANVQMDNALNILREQSEQISNALANIRYAVADEEE